MKSETRRQRMAQLLAEDDDDELLKLIQKEPEKTQEEINEEQAKSREAEAVLSFLRNPNLFVKRFCRQCHGEFFTDYGCVSYCSDPCRAAALHSMGIINWDTKKPLEKRWGNPIPLIVGPETLVFLRQSLDLTAQDQDSQKSDTELVPAQ